MAEKVNKTYLFSLSSPYRFVCVLFVMSPGTEKSGSIVVNDFITQFVLYFMS